MARTMFRELLADTRGSVTAEFAITIPAVLLVLGLVIGSVQLAAQRVSVTSLAGDLARLEARGDDTLAAERLRSFTGNPEVERLGDARILCVRVTTGPRSGILAAVAVSALGCAARSSEGGWRAGGTRTGEG